MTSPSEIQPPATLVVRPAENGTITVELAGAWRLRDAGPRLEPVRAALRAAGASSPKKISVQAGDVVDWDSALVIFAARLQALAAEHGATCDVTALPAEALKLLGTLAPGENAGEAEKRPRKLLTTELGELVHAGVEGVQSHMYFFGECVQALARVVLRPFAFRWAEGFEQMRRCGAAALPIVGLISALVGVIMAYVGAVQLRQFGADIFVADLVGLAVFREMGPMMAAIVLTGRTGAAFAAELGNMVLGEEVDALETFGVRPVDFLVAPRMLALLLMMPLLAIYADTLGVVGGAIVAHMQLDIVPAAFFVEMQTAVGLGDIATGLIKSVVFGGIVAYSGCYRGMRSGRSSVAVGESTTGAVVMGILGIIISDAVFTVIFNILGW